MAIIAPRDYDPKPSGTSGNLLREIYYPTNDQNYNEIVLTDIKNITTSTNEAETLPSPIDGVGVLRIGRYGSGTGTATFNAPASINIRWPDGATSTSIVFEGEGAAVLIERNGEIFVIQYEDFVNLGFYIDGTLTVAGRRLRKNVDGYAETWGNITDTSLDLNTSAGGFFTNTGITIDTGYIFSSDIQIVNSESTGSAGPTTRTRAYTTTGFVIQWNRGSSTTSASVSANYTAIAKWR